MLKSQYALPCNKKISSVKGYDLFILITGANKLKIGSIQNGMSIEWRVFEFDLYLIKGNLLNWVKVKWFMGAQ